mgnify:FL=1|tara:strand:+ start:33495 stop:34007 length:513 start_codon:yes stop_codon:yes gene_type:complete
MQNTHKTSESYQFDLFLDYKGGEQIHDQVMMDLRESSSGRIGPYLSTDLKFSQNCWQEEYQVRQKLRRYFEGQSPTVARSATIEELIEAWKELSEEYWCPDDRLKSHCDACGQPLKENAFLTLAGGTIIHFGGKWGSNCWTYLRLVNERERDEAIAALKRMDITAHDQDR